jgi:hypothetical protein
MSDPYAHRLPPGSPRQAGRVQYRARRGSTWFVVIADCRDDGTWDFGESEGDEPRWHPFTPTEEELAHARRLLAEGPAGSTFARESLCAS